MIVADTKHEGKATRRVFNLQISFLALEMEQKNTTKTKDIFSSNFQMT